MAAIRPGDLVEERIIRPITAEPIDEGKPVKH
jgi:hypothetical protein